MELLFDRELSRNLREVARADRSKMTKRAEEILNSQIVLITGPSCSGKTHICKTYIEEISTKIDGEVIFANGFEMKTRILLISMNEERFTEWAKDKKVVLIDNAHLVPGIYKSVKLLTKLLPHLKVILSFSTRELENIPVIRVYPISLSELQKTYPSVTIKEFIPEVLTYGMLPIVLKAQSNHEKVITLKEIVENNLLRNLIEVERINLANSIVALIKFLAKKINQQLTIQDFVDEIKINPRTIQRYLEMLKKHYIIHEHSGYQKRSKREVRAISRYYFYDLGIRNALIDDFSDIQKREDVENMWANFLVMERHKVQNLNYISHTKDLESYYWKVWESKAVDLLEENQIDGKISAFMFSFSGRVKRFPLAFTRLYPEARQQIITPDNLADFAGCDLKLEQIN